MCQSPAESANNPPIAKRRSRSVGADASCAFSALLIGFFSTADAAVCTWQGGDDIWSTPANWSCAASPGAADDAAINVGQNVALDISPTVANFSLAHTGATLSGAGTLSSTNDFDMQAGTVSAVLGGSVGLTKTTAGTVTLSGANTYTGNTQVNAGTLALGAGDVLANASSLVVNGGTFDLGANNDTVASVQLLAGSITGTGTLTSTSDFDMQAGTVSAALGGSVGLNKTTAGTVTLSGANTYTGNTQVNAGTLALGASDVLANTSSLVVSGGTFDLGANSDTVAGVQLLSGSITGSGTLTSNSTFDVQSGTVSAKLGGTNIGLNKTTAGTVTLSGANTYTGNTQVSAGTLTLGASDVLANTSSLIVNGGTFDLGANSDTVAGVQLLSGSITGTGTLTSTSDFDMQAGTVSAALGGSVGLNKTTAGTVTLSGSNTYTGTTQVSAGTLALGASDVIADASSLVVSGGSIFDLGANNDTVAGVQLLSGSITGTGTLTSTSTFDVQSGTVSAKLGGTNIGLNKTTAGTVTLSGSNTYTGTTQVSAGTLALGASDALANTSSLIVNGGTFDLGANNDTVAGVQLLSGSITGTGTLTSTSTFDVQSGTVSANLGGSAGLSKTTAGTVTLSGSNTYTGTTQVSAGTLTLGAGDVLANTSSLVVNGGTFDLGANNDTVTGVQLLSGSITGTGTLTSTSTFDVQSGTVSAALGGSVGLSKTTAGTVTLSGSNTYTGTTQVSAGTLALGAGDALANTSSLIVNGGTFDLGANNDTVAGVQLLSGSITGTGTLTSTSDFDMQAGTVSAALGGSVGLNKTTAGTVTLSGSDTYTGNTQVSAGTLALGASDVLANTSSLVVNGGTFDLGANNDTVAGVQLTSGSITGTGTLTSTSAFDVQSGTVSANLGGSVGLSKTTAGTVTLSGSNTYTGTTQVSAGTLALSASDALANTSSLVVDGGTFALGSHNDTVAGVRLLSGSITGTGTLTSNSAFDLQSGTVSANLGGGVGLNKTTSGTVTLSGTNSYTGNTLVDAGVLNFTGNNTHSGNFTGNGTLQFGAGTQQFNAGTNLGTANITFSGGTNLVNAGVALTATDAVFSGGTTTIAGDYSVSNSTTVSGGTVNFSSAATKQLNLGSTFTINNGTVNLQHTSTEVSRYVQTGGILSGPGELRVQSAVLSGGEMRGPGSLIISGSGGSASDLLLNGNFILNNQSTVINSGNVRVTSNASFIGNGTYRQTAGTTRVDGVWSQALTDIQAGSFGGNGSVSGPVINNGTVGIAGSHLTLNGPVSGSGSYAGIVDINNSFSPGPGANGQGIAAIDAASADLIFRQSSSLNLELGGVNGQLVTDSITARSIDIQGAKLNLQRLASQPNFSPQQAFSQSVLLQTTSGSISGNFNQSITCPEGSSDMFIFSKQEKQFLLTMVPRLPNLVPADVQSLANALQQIDCSASTPTNLQNLLNGLKPFLANGNADASKVDQFISALRQISPGQIAAEQTVSNQIAKLQTGNITQRLVTLRSASVGAGSASSFKSSPTFNTPVSSSMAIGSAPGVLSAPSSANNISSPNASSSINTPSSAPSAPTSSASSPNTPSSNAINIQASTPEKDGQSSSNAPSSVSISLSTDNNNDGTDLISGFSNLGLFINGQFEWADRTATVVQRGYASSMSAVTAGADYRLSKRLLLGLSAGYGSSTALISQQGGSQSIDGYTLSAFGSLNLTDNWYVDLVNNLTYNQYDSKRVTLYNDANGTAINETASSQTDGWQNRTSLSSGYDIAVKEWTFGLRGRTEYGYNFVNGRKEQGADLGMNMIVGELDNESLSSSIGAMVSHALSTPVGVLVSQVNVEWEHQWFNKNSLITTRFVDSPNNAFTTNSFSVDKDYINLRAGLSAQLPFGGSAFVQYDTTFGQEYVSRHAFNVGIRMEF
ncbi:autotransporter domain-containing protein [Methylomonas sp. EFPC1]|uniref:autotransporter-associated beta strand repeat-containing protein n=1 Tax=Methylomonas sp. EFPC1 TaxID=2812647 RepID=UPI0019678C46|nr:autotransporter-associated beta strand repeat-containing protein [Methylomonas sp. EFPC1]QSB02934.1 autotransporter domain-containing protein [Methylomonas sp. EFPC1]